MSTLKKSLNDWIQSKGYVSYDDVKEFCELNFFKVETATRTLRKSTSPNIRPIMVRKKKGGLYIKGYLYSSETGAELQKILDDDRAKKEAEASKPQQVKMI